ncbi:PiggyBac transposable element-derived protein 4 [Amphibalanus amphitrite]|uniref:PiggyBac transposable element-derived protein 4 n=1 Tax=Amphibalanus amphitrite TaxID=1232801 RepID=A0A6A4W1H2_AMPAM|nr:PiggyBac transposable element-derived protein 4 [Amphibalanus amphitrite]
MLADARSRYMLRMLPCAGVAHDPDPDLHVTGAANIVKHLVAPFKNSGRNVTADRFYTTIALCEELLEQNLTYVCTVQANRRDLPEEAKTTTGREQYSTQFYWSDGIMMASYNKKRGKNVLMLSTQHDQPLVDAGAAGKKKPEMMLYYNSTKGGIDTIDQMLDTYTCRVSTRRWPMAIFFFILDVAALNSWVVLSEATGQFADARHGGRKAFLQELGLSLIRPLVCSRPTDNMVMKTRLAVEVILKEKTAPPAAPQRTEAQRARCHLCTVNQHGNGYKKARSNSVNKTKKMCARCRRSMCGTHRVSHLVVCERCAE